mgnify:CR=1 FL=1
MMRLSYRGRYAIYSRSVIGCLQYNYATYDLSENNDSDSKKFGSKLFSVDERSSALFLYKKGHHLSSYATIKAIKPNQSEV